MNDDLTTLLRPLDAAPQRADEAYRRRRDAMLERVLAASDAAPAASRRSARPRPVRRVVFGAAAALVLTPALLIGGVLVADRFHPGADDANASGFTAAQLAQWTSTPTPQTAERLSPAIKDFCTTATNGQAGASASVGFTNSDQRGQIASTVITRGAYRDLCIASPSSGSGTSEIIDGSGSPLPAVAAREVLLQSGGSQGDPATAINSVWGQAGSDIRAIVLHVDDHVVSATVGHGIWSAWWPAERIGFDSPTTATVTYSDGGTATVEVVTP